MQQLIAPAARAAEAIDPLSARIPAVAFQNLVGASAAIRRTITVGCRLAAHRVSSVLIQGETGTGKELFARGIHYSSDAAGEPFVAINCAAIPENLLESELFGHERGAFSGAVSSKPGLFEFALKGTVFLDEIGELPLSLQPKLLRLLEEKRVRRLGSLKERAIECRIIAATNRDLAARLADGSFREDLYYRLSVVRVEMPALRERAGDIDYLAAYFLDQLTREYRAPTREFSAEALELLRGYAWPGNVRELKNAIEGALVICDGRFIRPEHLSLQAQPRTAPCPTDSSTYIEVPVSGIPLHDAERQLITATLRLAGGNQSRAARMLQVSRTTLMRKCRRYGLHTKIDPVP